MGRIVDLMEELKAFKVSPGGCTLGIGEGLSSQYQESWACD